MDNAAKVAAKLTETQRNALGYVRSKHDDDRLTLSPYVLASTRCALARKGLVRGILLTPFGIAVRTALADRGGDR